MKRFLLILCILCPLWACSSCDDNDDKLPGSKPEILLGKWETSYDLYWTATVRNVVETYEFTKSGGAITQVTTYTYPVDYKPVDTFVIAFSNWSYDKKEIHFFHKKNSYSNTWSQPVYKLTPDSLSLGTGPNNRKIFYKVKE